MNVAVIAAVALAVALGATIAVAAAPTPVRAKLSEAVRLRLAAALLDLGNYLMLSAEERRAFRLRKTLSSARARRLGLYVVAVKAGARRLDDVTLEIPIGERPQEGNPKRTLALSCVVYGTPDRGASDRPKDVPALFWRVANGPSSGHRGPSVTVDVPDLERALISYYARPLRLAGGAIGASFFDEGTHDGQAK